MLIIKSLSSTHTTNHHCDSLQVSVLGDGRAEDVIVAGDKLSNVDALLKIGGELPLPSSVSHSKDALAQKVSM